jgi:hypothetical protein
MSTSNDTTRWESGQPLTKSCVGSPVHYRSRGKWCDGIIEAVGDLGYVRVRLPNGRSKAFRRFYKDGQDVWLTGIHGRSRTRLFPGTAAEWEAALASLRAERDPPIKV